MESLQELMAPFHQQLQIAQKSTLRNKTFLITGASGLIGSNLIAFLDFLNKTQRMNISITGITRSGLASWMPTSKNITYLRFDLSKKKYIPKKHFDFVIHCATYGQPKKFLSYPIETIRLNINVLLDLLALAKKNKATFLCLSSSEIYGEADKKNIPTSESYYGYVNTLSDRAIYAESKRLAETICYFHSKSMNVKIARVLIGYGPGVRYDDMRVIPEFIKKAQNDGVITMMDQGKAQRTFCFIADTIEMLLNIVLSGKELVYNVSGNQTITIAKLAKVIASLNQAQVKLPQAQKGIEGTPQRSAISNKRYCNEFKKKSFVDLKSGLAVTSKWFDNLKPSI